jgi:AcrR family transcriptional regulator
MTTAGTRIPYAEAAKALLRDTLLGAATELIRDRGWSETTMAEVAAAAGVSRQTLYKEFGSRQALGAAYIERESARFVADVEQAIQAHVDRPRVALTAAIEVFLAAAAEEPLVRALVARPDADGLLTTVTDHSGPILTGATNHLAAFIARCWPQVPMDECALLMQTVVRLAISHAASPTTDPARTAANITHVVGPYVDQVTGIRS